jgi:hypothetical protein
VKLDTASNYTPELVTASLRALDACWREGYRYKKAGVMFLDLHDAGAVQTSFSTLGPEQQAKRDAAMRMLGDAVLARGLVSQSCKAVLKTREDFVRKGSRKLLGQAGLDFGNS